MILDRALMISSESRKFVIPVVYVKIGKGM